jgi:tetratricopeptide (TPR) repeat protein
MAVWANDYAPIAARVTHVYPWTDRILYAASGALTSLGDLFLPLHLSAFYPHPALSLAALPPSFWIGLAAFGALGLLVLLFRRSLPMPLLALGLGWSLLTWLPVSGLLPFSEAWRADRFLYIPQIGVWLIVFSLLGTLLVKRPAVHTGAVALLCIFAALASSRRIQVWRSTTALFQDAYQKSEGCYYAAFKLGYLAHKKGDLPRALKYFSESVNDEPDFARAWSALGVVHARQNHFPQAEECFTKATRLNPYLPDAWYNLGRLQLVRGNTALGKKYLEKAYRLEPKLRKREATHSELEK